MIFIRYYFFCLLCPYWASVRYIECKQCHTQKRIRFTSTHNSGEQSKQEYYNNHCMDTRSPRVCVCFLIACENYVFTTNSILPQWEIFKKTKNTHFFIAVISRMISCRSFYHKQLNWLAFRMPQFNGISVVLILKLFDKFYGACSFGR